MKPFNLSQHLLRSAVNVKDWPYNAKGDGVTDDTAAFHAARDELIGQGGGTLFVPAGTYRVALELTTRNVNVVGEGMLATTLRPTTPDGVAVRALYYVGSWDFVTIADIGFEGVGTRQGIGFATGPDAYVANAEYVGRTIFDRCRFDNFDKCASFQWGGIGKWFNDCSFVSANFHIWCKGNGGTAVGGVGDAMHAGNITVSRGHMQQAQKASVYIDGQNAPGGGGQYVFDSVIMEANPGWCFYFKNFGGWAQPQATIRSCWNEANHSAASVVIDGEANIPGWLYAEDNATVTVHDTSPTVVLLLNNSTMTTHDCDIYPFVNLQRDNSDIVVNHHNARAFTGIPPGVTLSIAKPGVLTTQSPYFAMPRPVGIYPPQFNVLWADDAQKVINFTGSILRDTVPNTYDPGIPWLNASQELTINAGDTLIPLGMAIHAYPGAYFVHKYLYRLISGPDFLIQCSGATSLGGAFRTTSLDWATATTICYINDPSAPDLQWYHFGPASGTSKILIGGFSTALFNTAREALAYANLPLFPTSQRNAYTPTGVTPTFGFNPATVTLPQLGHALGTLINDLKLGKMPK